MRPLRALLTVAFVLVVTGSVAAADRPTEDSVVLKNGQLVTGKILDDDPKLGVTIKLSSGKVQVIPANQVKMVDRASTPTEKKATPKKEDDEPEEKPKPKKRAAEPEETEAKPPPSPSGGLRDANRYGINAVLGVTFSRQNVDSTLTLLSPYLGLRGVAEVGASDRIYLRFEGALGTYSRSSTSKVVLSVDTRKAGTTAITEGDITNRARLYELSARALLGFDFNDAITSRAGVILGYGVGAVNGSRCDRETSGGLVYGMSVHPIAMRFLERKTLEVGVVFDYFSAPLPKCDVPTSAGPLPVQDNAVTTFIPKVVPSRSTVGVLGLGFTYVF